MESHDGGVFDSGTKIRANFEVPVRIFRCKLDLIARRNLRFPGNVLRSKARQALNLAFCPFKFSRSASFGNKKFSGEILEGAKDEETGKSKEARQGLIREEFDVNLEKHGFSKKFRVSCRKCELKKSCAAYFVNVAKYPPFFWRGDVLSPLAEGEQRKFEFIVLGKALSRPEAVVAALKYVISNVFELVDVNTSIHEFARKVVLNVPQSHQISSPQMLTGYSDVSFPAFLNSNIELQFVTPFVTKNLIKKRFEVDNVEIWNEFLKAALRRVGVVSGISRFHDLKNWLFQNFRSRDEGGYVNLKVKFDGEYLSLRRRSRTHKMIMYMGGLVGILHVDIDWTDLMQTNLLNKSDIIDKILDFIQLLELTPYFGAGKFTSFGFGQVELKQFRWSA